MNETAHNPDSGRAESTGREAAAQEPLTPEKLKALLEGALLAAGQPLSLNQLNALFDEGEQPGHGMIRQALALLDAELADRAIELVEVAGGFRLQIRRDLMPVVSRLWTEKPPRYSRALLETLAIIAYRQPITRGEIEQIRGVSLSTNILKTLQEREWIKVVGHRDIPGKPELLGTTRAFLDYFGLKGLDDLPTLAEIRDLENLEPELDFDNPDKAQTADEEEQAKPSREYDQGQEPTASEEPAGSFPQDRPDSDQPRGIDESAPAEERGNRSAADDGQTGQ